MLKKTIGHNDHVQPISSFKETISNSRLFIAIYLLFFASYCEDINVSNHLEIFYYNFPIEIHGHSPLSKQKGFPFTNKCFEF